MFYVVDVAIEIIRKLGHRWSQSELWCHFEIPEGSCFAILHNHSITVNRLFSIHIGIKFGRELAAVCTL